SRAGEPMQTIDVVLQSSSRTACAGISLAGQTRVALVEARDCLTRAILCQRTACAGDPANRTFPHLLYEHYHDVLVVELLLGNHRGAAKTARELPKVTPDGASDYVLAAECVARCIPLVKADTGLSMDDREKLGETYALEAVKLLREAVTRGFRGVQELRTVPAYEPLRGRADFRNLLDGMEKNVTRTG